MLKFSDKTTVYAIAVAFGVALTGMAFTIANLATSVQQDREWRAAHAEKRQSDEHAANIYRKYGDTCEILACQNEDAASTTWVNCMTACIHRHYEAENAVKQLLRDVQ